MSCILHNLESNISVQVLQKTINKRHVYQVLIKVNNVTIFNQTILEEFGDPCVYAVLLYFDLWNFKIAIITNGIYLYIYVCIHIYTHIYIQIYIHTYIHTHVLYIGLWTFGKIIWKYVWSKYSSESKNAFISGAWWSPHNWLILLTINAVTIYRYPKIWHCVLGRILCQAYFNSLYTLQWWFI